jgi:hypothetical protein
MRGFRAGHAAVTAVLSAVFAILLYPAIVDTHGAAMSVFYVALGVTAIWGIYYFLWGAVWRHFYERGRKEEREKPLKPAR